MPFKYLPSTTTTNHHPPPAGAAAAFSKEQQQQQQPTTTNDDAVIVLGERPLTLEDIVQVARHGAKVALTNDAHVLQRIEASHAYILHSVRDGRIIYGVTTGFGGMGHLCTTGLEEAAQLQQNLLWLMKTGAGKWLDNAAVRAAMLLRANSLVQGASGIRLELIQRIMVFLNANVTPRVHELGSIGASGDLVPLAAITGALIGLDESFLVDFDGQEMGSVTATERLGLPRLKLEPKEGLAMINGTSVMCGMAALCVQDAQELLRLVLAIHALLIQGLAGTNQSFHPFIHQLKPHPGQCWAAEQMLALLEGSKLIRNELQGERGNHGAGELVQDRYSLRCLPQFIGPITDGLETITKQIVVEANSVTDNPLIDVDKDTDYHGGNFLGEYVAVAMDQLRYYIGLLAKHVDAQIALAVAPAFSRGLPPSLVGVPDSKVNMGLKGLQICGNAIMPLLSYYGNSLADRFPTHAEQFNQNINSQGFGSALLTRQSIDTFVQYLAIALIVAVQACDLRTYKVGGNYCARNYISPATCGLYDAVYKVAGKESTHNGPLIENESDQPFDLLIADIANSVTTGGDILQSIAKCAPGHRN